MEKIVNGKRYDTETAEGICSWSIGHKSSDPGWEENGLYLTAKGNWFLAGKGGPMSQWRERVGNLWSAGEGLKPVRRDEARALLIEYGNYLQVTEYFAVEEA